MNNSPRRAIVLSAAIVCVCFLLTSTGWLAWEYHLMEQVSPRVSDAMTMVVGYLLQAAGIGAYALLTRRWSRAAEKAVPAALLLHTLCLIPAILSKSAAGTLAAGFLVDLFCGGIAGYYLQVLTVRVPAERRAGALGLGYGVSILASWLLAKLGGAIYYSSRVWIICFVLTAAALALFRLEQRGKETAAKPQAAAAREDGKTAERRGLLVTVGVVVLLFSVVNNSGFAFSSADLVQGIRVESSRLFYAVGLILAGFVMDRERKYGAAATLAALMIPFIMLALRAEPVSLTVFWALSYFTYGFYSVYRMIVFSDLAEQNALPYLAGFGLLLGRIGDAAGEAVCLALLSSPTVLIFLTALLFLAAVFLFLRVYRLLYLPETSPEQSERERFYQFAVQHDLSSRERDMLRLLLEEKTNAEIADVLSISENTVKFHIRNLLQKTGCKNRSDLIAVYQCR